jgi:hypothetical protein
MLTMDDLLAVLNTLDLTHVDRIILVGDPNQLPPIGVGRPFADLVGHLRVAQEVNQEIAGTISGAFDLEFHPTIANSRNCDSVSRDLTC